MIPTLHDTYTLWTYLHLDTYTVWTWYLHLMAPTPAGYDTYTSWYLHLDIPTPLDTYTSIPTPFGYTYTSHDTYTAIPSEMIPSPSGMIPTPYGVIPTPSWEWYLNPLLMIHTTSGMITTNSGYDTYTSWYLHSDMMLTSGVIDKVCQYRHVRMYISTTNRHNITK